MCCLLCHLLHSIHPLCSSLQQNFSRVISLCVTSKMEFRGGWKLTFPSLFTYICHASARPPAFLSTTPHIPSSLEGTRSHKALNGYHLCSQSMVIEHCPLNQTPPSCHVAKSQPIRGFPAIESRTF